MSTIVPATPGWFVLEARDRGAYAKYPVIAWRIEDAEYAWPIPDNLDCMTPDPTVMRPDGTVFKVEPDYASFSARRDMVQIMNT